MGADFLNIPGNIRQIYLPFSIAGAGKIQVFSFKSDREGQAVAQIFPFPKTFQQLFGADSGFQYSHGPDGSSQIDYKTFLDQIPSFQIREFVPDARLTQVFKWFTYFKRAFDAATENVDYKTFDVKGVAEQLKNAMSNLGQGMRDLTSGSASLLASVAAGLQHYYKDKGFSFGADAGYAVLWIPFLLYYRLTTTHTNTIYELPYSSTDPILVSDGTYGWATGGQSIGIADWLGNLGGIGDFVKSGFGSTIRVNVMPSFDPTSNGGTTTGSTITVTIDLINDSDIAACNNFLFCHTLFGNNRWLQYGFVQASGSLYDVKLPGANRYFMCTGKFKCEGRGAFRSPSDTVVNYIFSCANNKGMSFGESLAKALGSESDALEMRKGIANAAAESKMMVINRQTAVEDRSLLRKRAEPATVVGNQYKWLAESQVKTTVKANGSDVQVPNPATVKTYRLDAGLEESVVKNSQIYAQNTEIIQNANQKISQNERTIASNDAKIDTITSSQEYRDAISRRQNKELELDFAKENANEAKEKWTDAERAYQEYEDQMVGTEEYDPVISAQLRAKADAAMSEYAGAETAVSIVSEELDSAIEAEMDAGGTEIAELEADSKNLESESAQLQADKENAEQALRDNDNQQAIDETRSKLAAQEQASLDSRVTSASQIKDLIKIPDVYHITLEFGSLIPDNFNTYLYGFREANLDMFKNYAVGGVDETGVFEKLADKLTEALSKKG